MSRGAKTILPSRRESRSPTALRRCNIFTLCEETRGCDEIGGYRGTHLPVDLPDGRSTTSYTLRDAPDPRGSRRVFRKSTEKPREFTRVLQWRLPSTFVALAAFIDGKSVADLRSRISVEKPEERCHFIRRDCRRYMPHRKICRRRKLDRHISRRCLAQCHVLVVNRIRSQVNKICNCQIEL